MIWLNYPAPEKATFLIKKGSHQVRSEPPGADDWRSHGVRAPSL